MKPRIFLYSSEDNSQVEMISSLYELEQHPFDFFNTKYLIHIGFNPPPSSAINELLDELPIGFYCSSGFRDSGPGKLWQFTDVCGKISDLIYAFLISDAPILGFHIEGSTLQTIKGMHQGVNVNSFQIDENIISSGFNFSVRTRNVFENEKIVMLSDLVNLTEADLLLLPNFGRTSLNEVKKYLNLRGQGLGQTSVYLNPTFFQNSRAETPPEGEDEYLAHLDFSVRTRNVFQVENIVMLSDLVKLTEAHLLRLPNFGRKSLKEVKEFLSTRSLELDQPHLNFVAPEIKEINPKDLISDSVENDLKTEIERLDDERIIEILFNRIGFGGRKTLQALGEKYGVTRERIRQLEAQGILKILKNPNNFLSLWNKIILEHVQASLYPIEIEQITRVDNAFISEEVRAEDLLTYLIKLNKRDISDYSNGLQIANFQGRRFVSEISEEEFDELHKFILEIMLSSVRIPLSTLKSECFKFATNQKQKYFNLIFENELSNSLISRRDDGTDIFVKYVKKSNIEIALQLLIDHINAADGPISKEELDNFVEKRTRTNLHSFSNALANNDEIFPYRHGLWTTFQHLDFTEWDKKIIIKYANAKLENNPYAQLHCRELEEELSGKLSSDLNYFAIAGILNKFSDLSYLGRSVFCLKGAQIDQRFYIHDALVNVLRAHERPMHRNDLIQEAKRLVSISDNYQPNLKAPLINIGSNTFALDYWDI